MAVKTYKQHLAEGNAPQFSEDYPTRNFEEPRYQCPVCDRFEWPELIVDVSMFTALNGAQWACCQCRTEWARDKQPLNVGDDHLTEEDWQVTFHIGIGATEQEISDRKKYAAKSFERLLAAAKINGNTTLEAKIVAKASIPNLAVSKTNIVANGVDTAAISNLPVGTEVTVDNSAPNTINDGVFELAATNAGVYNVRAKHPHYIAAEVEIDAN